MKKYLVFLLCFLLCSGTIFAAGDETLVVRFTDYSGEAAISAEQAADIGIYVSDEVQYVEILVGGIPYARMEQSPYRADLSALGVGNFDVTVRAENLAGERSEDTVHFQITKSYASILLEESKFEEYTSSTQLVSGIRWYNQRGYVKADTVDDTHGQSLFIGIDEANAQYTEKQYPYANVPISAGKSNLTIEFDTYVSAKTMDSSNFRICLKQDGGSEIRLISFQQEGSKMLAGPKSLDYEAQKWYQFRMEADMTNCCYTLYMKEEGTETWEMICSDQALNSGFTSLDALRFYGPVTDTVKTYMAVDNIRISMQERLPVLTVEGENEIDFQSAALKVRLAGGSLYGPSIHAENISITDGENTLRITEAVYSSADNEITITLGTAMRSDTTYLLRLSDAMLSEETEAGATLSAVFHTSMDVLAANTSFVDGQAKITAFNHTEDARDIYIIIGYWDGENRFYGMNRSMQTLAPNSSENVLSAGGARGGSNTSRNLCLGQLVGAPHDSGRNCNFDIGINSI